MTSNTKIEVLWIFGDFRLQDTFQKRIAPKSLEINKDKLHTKFFSIKRMDCAVEPTDRLSMSSSVRELVRVQPDSGVADP